MSALSRYSGEIGEDIEEQVRRLRSEIAAIGRSLEKRGTRGYSASQEQLSDLYDEIHEHLQAVVPHVRRHARIAGRAVRDNSTAIVVGAILVGALAALIFARR